MNACVLLPLLLLLPATSAAFFLPIPTMKPQPHSYSFHPSELCPLIHIVEHELCNDAALKHYQPQPKGSPSPELCGLLQQYNNSFCANVDKPKEERMSNDDMSVIVLQKEFHDATANQSDEKHNVDIDIHKLCPILNFINQELCSSRNQPHPHSAQDEVKVGFDFDPKQLCPLLNLTYTEFCQ